MGNPRVRRSGLLLQFKRKLAPEDSPSPEGVLSALMEGLEVETVGEILPVVIHMAHELEKLDDVTYHLDELKHHADQVRELLPEGAR